MCRDFDCKGMMLFVIVFEICIYIWKFARDEFTENDGRAFGWEKIPFVKRKMMAVKGICNGCLE